jgi:uncharacterized membrane protein YgcG
VRREPRPAATDQALARAAGLRRVTALWAPLALSLCLLVSSGASAAFAAETRELILDFHSNLLVQADGTLSVTETITVESAGRKIRRGIYRDFPTTYKGRYGNTITVDFDIAEVRRDGKPEPYHTERYPGGVRIYIGIKDVRIARGRHTYTLIYRTNRQLGFFEDFDELYWNVTGSDWAFDIERASATVTLPQGAHVLDWAAYTGRPGERGQDFRRADATAGAAIRLATTRTLRPGEGFTIAVAWPRGFVAHPTQADEAAYFLRDNGAAVAGLGGFVVLLVYFVTVWRRVGRDPDKGTIVPHYEPPAGVSPAAARYLMGMGFDDKIFTSAVVSAAVKGALTIEEDDPHEYTLVRAGAPDGLSGGEKAMVGKLFGRSRERIALEQSNHEKLQKAKDALKRWLKAEFEKVYFVTNRRYLVPALAITGLAIVLLAGFANRPAEAAFMSVWLTVWSAGCYLLGVFAASAWRLAFSGGGVMHSAKALFSTVFALPFFGGWVFGLSQYADAVSAPAAGTLAAIILLDLVFHRLLKAPTRLGRRVMDRIEGFRLYLSVVEQDRMNLLNPPERTPELFERFLPYALALGVEQAWSEQFSDVLAAAGRPEAEAGYRPRWYSGRSFDVGTPGDFAASLGGSLSSAISSASTAPSSSGSSGGGFSGGGGGGGGGGGW